jgi:hypothetical protein
MGSEYPRSQPMYSQVAREGLWVLTNKALTSIIAGEFFVSSIVSYPERWRDGPCETLATCESKVPIPAGGDAGKILN